MAAEALDIARENWHLEGVHAAEQQRAEVALNHMS